MSEMHNKKRVTFLYLVLIPDVASPTTTAAVGCRSNEDWVASKVHSRQIRLRDIMVSLASLGFVDILMPSIRLLDILFQVLDS